MVETPENVTVESNGIKIAFEAPREIPPEDRAEADIECVFDPVLAMAQMGFRLEPDRHAVMRDGMWIEWARREFRKPHLFLYHHLVHDRVVLAEWIHNSGDVKICAEIESFPVSPDHDPDVAPIPWLRLRLKSSREMVESMRRKAKEAWFLKRQMRGEAEDRRLETYRLLKSKGLELDAMRVLESCGENDFFRDEVSEMIEQRLLDALQTKRHF